MNESFSENNFFLRTLFDAIPNAILVTNKDLHIIYWNVAAQSLLGSDSDAIYRKRGGEAMHCINHRNAISGCGHAPRCKDCVIRNSVYTAFNGEGVSRERTMVEVQTGDVVTQVPLLVTSKLMSFDGQPLSLLILEDISEIIKLRDFLPICAHCKKIRNDQNYWQEVESYISAHVMDLNFSHSICPTCREELYPGM